MMMRYLVQCLFDLLELFGCQGPWVDTFDFTTKVGELGSISRGRKGEGSKLDSH